MLFFILIIHLIIILIIQICQGLTRPLVIGHRGSAYLPELTLESQSMAHALKADMIEIDVCLSRDNQLIVTHDLYLNAISNVDDIFPNRNRSDGYHYVIDFDLNELRRLTIHERTLPFINIQVYPSRFPASSAVPFHLSTLNETVELLFGLSHSTNRQYQLLIEIKNPEYHTQYNRSISSILLSTLNAYNLTEFDDPIVIQTFHIEELIYIRKNLGSKLRLIALLTWNRLNESSSDYDFYRSEQGLQNLSTIVQGIAPNMELLVNFAVDESIINVTNLTLLAHKYNLAVYPWTFRLMTIISSESNINESSITETIIDIYSENITIKWEIFHINKCGKNRTINVSLFNCVSNENYLNFTDMSCLQNKTLTFDEATCSVTTFQSILLTTEGIKTTTKSTTRSPPGPFECENKNYIGNNCSIPNDICQILQPCENQGICCFNETLSLPYICKCPLGYSGYNCEHDNRICKNNTCWHDGVCVEMNGTVSINNQTTFKCICEHGYDGSHCELISDMCINITCQNKGICFPSHLSWTCLCLDPELYSGSYCEHKSSSLVVKQVLSKSFASIAIVAIIAVFLFVIIMDILKYVFKIDPVDRERRLMELEQKKKHLNKNRKKRRKKNPIRFFYIS
ncbi:unnamed protein product [Rotaria sp. Silwood2]|nr:unnamed protein product [Rotaria sp. Silwood2]